jgi:predicted 2-oxoglutarate/Fe(II)-dependent dioxygenase YbiX
MGKDSNHAPFDLLVVENFLDHGACAELVAEMQRSPKAAALTYGQTEAGAINERVRKLARVQPSPESVAQVITRLEDLQVSIEEHFGVKLSSLEEPQFLCYREGDFFVAHQDGNTGLVNLDSDRLRRISISVFLNPQSEVPVAGAYGGGLLVFSDWRTRNEFRFAGETGTLVAFRSETTHEVTPVTRGERYSVVSWFRSEEGDDC